MKDFETFRKKLPDGVELIVAKNTLVEKAVEGTKFEPLKAACTGTNAFLFCGEDIAARCARRRSFVGATSMLASWLLADLLACQMVGRRRGALHRQPRYRSQVFSCPLPAERASFASHVTAASRPSTRWRRC